MRQLISSLACFGLFACVGKAPKAVDDPDAGVDAPPAETGHLYAGVTGLLHGGDAAGGRDDHQRRRHAGDDRDERRGRRVRDRSRPDRQRDLLLGRPCELPADAQRPRDRRGHARDAGPLHDGDRRCRSAVPQGERDAGRRGQGVPDRRAQAQQRHAARGHPAREHHAGRCGGCAGPRHRRAVLLRRRRRRRSRAHHRDRVQRHVARRDPRCAARQLHAQGRPPEWRRRRPDVDRRRSPRSRMARRSP